MPYDVDEANSLMLPIDYRKI